MAIKRTLQESATWTRAEDGSSRQPPKEWLHIFPVEIRPAVQAVIDQAPVKMGPLRVWVQQQYPELSDEVALGHDKGWLMWDVIVAECVRRGPDVRRAAEHWQRMVLASLPWWMKMHFGRALFCDHTEATPVWVIWQSLMESAGADDN